MWESDNPWRSPEDVLIELLESIQPEKLTPFERRQLELLRDLTTRESALVIAHLEYKKDKTPHENRQLELLLDPDTRKKAMSITELEFKEQKTLSEERKLELLLNPLIHYPHTVMNIIMLEDKLSGEGDISHDELQQLNNFYMKLIFKEPTDTLNTQQYLTNICKIRGVQNQLDFFSCSSEFDSTSKAPREDEHSPTFFPPNFRRKAALKTVEQHITSLATKLVDYYLRCQTVPTSYRSLKTMQDYIETKIKHLAFYLKKYFTHFDTPDFSRDALEGLEQYLIEKISLKELTLSNKEVLLHLNRHINHPPLLSPTPGNSST